MAKNKEDIVEFVGIVKDCLPSHFIVHWPERNIDIKAVISGKIRKNQIRILVGDEVKVEVSAYDPSKGRIVFRIKNIPPAAS